MNELHDCSHKRKGDEDPLSRDWKWHILNLCDTIPQVCNKWFSPVLLYIVRIRVVFVTIEKLGFRKHKMQNMIKKTDEYRINIENCKIIEMLYWSFLQKSGKGILRYYIHSNIHSSKPTEITVFSSWHSNEMWYYKPFNLSESNWMVLISVYQELRRALGKVF